MMALCMTAVMGFAALGLDLSVARYARLQLENATDAAAHAALVRLRTTGSTRAATSMAIAVAAANRVAGKALTVRGSDITYGGWNFATHTFTAGVWPPNAVQVDGLRTATTGHDGPIRTAFARILGKPSVNLSARGTAAFRIRSMVIAQDITMSFTGSIDDAGRADLALLDYLHALHSPADRIGMQMFTGGGTEWTPLTNVASGYWTVRSQWYGDGLPTGSPAKTSGITVCNRLDVDPTTGPPYDYAWVPACSTGGDATNPGAALKAATDQLLASTNPYETRVIVLVTDGSPQCCSYRTPDQRCVSLPACTAQLAQYGIDMADAADAAGISVFGVSFGASASQAAYVASLARGIGTGYDTPDSTQLARILTEIGGTVPIALVR